MDREELIRLFSPQLRLAMGMPTRRSSRHS